MKSISKRLWRRIQKHRRIDCRWCGRTIFTAAPILITCPNCQAALPERINLYLIVLFLLLTSDVFVYFLKRILSLSDLGTQLKPLMTANYATLLVGLVTLLLLRLVYILAKKLVYVWLFGFVYKIWGWSYDARLNSWYCTPTDIPKSSIARDFYVFAIQRGVKWDRILIGILIFEGLLFSVVARNPIPQELGTIPQYMMSTIFWLNLPVFLLCLVPFLNFRNVLLISIFGMSLAQNLPSIYALIDGQGRTGQSLQILLILEGVSFITIPVTYLLSYYYGRKLSRFCFGEAIALEDSRPVTKEEMLLVRTQPVEVQTWYDRFINWWSQNVVERWDT